MLVTGRYNPGGQATNNIGALASNLRRKNHHPQEKVAIIEKVKAWMAATGVTLSRAAKNFGVS